MAGFGVFRSYQKASLVALAILSMLAFFVLPPLLQFGGQSAGIADTPVARWKGGEIRERGIDRAVTMTGVVNRFLGEAVMASGRDPAQAPAFPMDEEAVVRTMLMAEEARKAGIVVSDAAVNGFLDRITNYQVRAEQFDQIMQSLEGIGGGVSQGDLFDALRNILLADSMQGLVQGGLFVGDPPGLRWDYFRRLEESATIETVGIDVRSVADEVPLPQTAVLRAFYEKHKNDLPDPASDQPGFREPHRARVEYVVAPRDVFVEEISKEVSEEDIAEFYEKNKATMFRAQAKPPVTAPAAGTPAAETPATETPAAETPAAETPATEAPATETPSPAADAPAVDPPADPPADPAAESPAAGGDDAQEPPAEGAAVARGPFRSVSFQAPDEPAAPAAASEPPIAVDPVPAPAAGTEAPAAPAVPPAADPGAVVVDDPAQFEPLDAVRERIRTQIARERAEAKVDIIFDRLSADVAGYNESYALWQAREKARGIEPPKPPDVEAIAKVQGLVGTRSELWSELDAREAGGIGTSGTMVRDPSSRFGVREMPWVAMVYGQSSPGVRPMRTSDREGNRYLSWRVEDRPEFTPSFEQAREAVEKAWRIVEGRAAARAKAEALAAKAAGAESLEGAIAGDASLQVVKAGPFFWINPQAAMMGMVQISQPTGIVIPGDEFMAKVFSLRPGEVGVAFNEPKTVCYCIRLIDVEPPEETLKERFVARRGDPGMTAAAAQEARMRALRGWVGDLEARYGVEWLRKPR
jgi:hypothetical protein